MRIIYVFRSHRAIYNFIELLDPKKEENPFEIGSRDFELNFSLLTFICSGSSPSLLGEFQLVRCLLLIERIWYVLLLGTFSTLHRAKTDSEATVDWWNIDSDD